MCEVIVMATRKSMTLPIVVTFLFIIIVVYLFTSIKQTEVVCEKVSSFDSDVRLKEEIISRLDGKKIVSMYVSKTITLPDQYADDDHLEKVKLALDNTLEYLGKKVKYTIGSNRIIVTMDVHKNEVLLLDNIQFRDDGDLKIKVNSNTKSSEVVTLTIGDNYTDGEFMKRMKKDGYSCK